MLFVVSYDALKKDKNSKSYSLFILQIKFAKGEIATNKFDEIKKGCNYYRKICF